MRLLLRKAKSLQISLDELNRGRNPAERLITRDLSFESTVDVANMADAVRDYLGVSVEEQQAWRDGEDMR